MGLPCNAPLAGLLFAFALSTCLYIIRLNTHEITMSESGTAEQTITKQHERFAYNNRAKQNDSVHPNGTDPERPQEPAFSKEDKCTMAPENRFDCGRDRLLSQRECLERGCCYAPLSNVTGPPWCFYPTLYPGYKMGPLVPTTQGQAATLTRANPSYLPRDISTLHLQVMQETAGCLHISVSTQHCLFFFATI